MPTIYEIVGRKLLKKKKTKASTYEKVHHTDSGVEVVHQSCLAP
jgi:hypothetical protein